MSAMRPILEGLDSEQKAAVLAPRGPVCVLAGAGTGKTRTITRRIAALVVSGHVASGQVLAVTFTARAAGELRTRLRALGVEGAQARTFHAAALRQLRYFWPRVVGDRPWDVIDRKLPLVGRAANQVGLSTDADSLRDLAAEIEWAKASLIAADDYPAEVARRHRDTPVSAELVARVYAGYEHAKRSARLLDFDDLLLHTAAALEDSAEIADEFRGRYRCFVVDEYQDITPAQQRLLHAWLGGRDDLTVVGDANQTIYSFTGASPTPLLDFGRRFPGATVVRLERDYRSTPQVVSLANQVITAAVDRRPGSRLRLSGQRAAGPRPEFAEFDDETAEAKAVATRIAALIDEGVPVSEIAVLYRVNAQSEVYEQALAERDIPYLVRGGQRFFLRGEVRRAMTALRTAAASEVDGASGGTLVDQVRAVLRAVGLTASAPRGRVARQRWESLAALVELATDVAVTVPGAGLGRFVAELELRADAQHPPKVAGITLASLHAAKGLEWDAVFLVGLAEGTLPISHAGERRAAIEEERRLLYVGVTRARERLWLSWALSRQQGDKRHRRRSRFLHGLIPDDHPVLRGRPSPSPGRPAKPRCRNCGSPLLGALAIKLGRCEHCPSDVDEELLRKLKQWRSRRAEDLSVPAYAVLTDATLVAIAERRPVDAASLVRISGIGSTKLMRYGDDIISLVTGGSRDVREDTATF